MNSELFSKLVEIVFIYIPELILVMFLSVKLLEVRISSGKLLLICIIHGAITTPLVRHIGISIILLHTMLLLLLMILTILIISRIDITTSVILSILTMVIILFSEFVYFNVVTLFSPSTVSNLMDGPSFVRVLVFLPLALFYLSLNILRGRFNVTMSLRR